ncbi:Gfo/Idh/MocA family protein [Natronolimnohabitans innermongolicus]|uniref:Oxidoreductase domain-containing protein n=1 Tax=Natronolimnohabitans innermongolicus JCM 12255 TaxID=1227499 RepID=L9WR95_9EURY|nr:Gfo/Idh/MocA family oxidoreductase [Natronolimnohabitans innermongolicus]ELY51736.1 oxidoreductase domain-containing protein [Natronolimnohabitans innermongolicus JCM 12255]
MDNVDADPIRIGIVGLGYIGTTVGEQFHRRADATVKALCDLDADRLATVGPTFDVPDDSRYTDYETMLETEPLEAVLVGTPHTLHYEQVVAALERDCHVYCDKPLTTDLERARDLAERAEAGAETLMVGYQRHLQTAFREARERFADSPPTWLTASMTQGWIDDSRGTWRLDPDLSGGGFLYDTGSHVLDGVLWTTGLEPESVAASMDFHDADDRIDRRAHLDVRFANGATGTFSFNGDAPAVREHVHCWDDDGAVYLEGRQWGSRSLTEIDADAGEYEPYIDARAERTRAEAFLESVQTDTEPPATARDALRVTALTEAAYEAARTGERVEVSTE